MAGVCGKFISPFTASEPATCNSEQQHPAADCENSPLLQFTLPDTALLNDSLDDDLNPDLLLEAKLPTESAAMDSTDESTIKMANLDDSLCCEDMDETQLPLGCGDEPTTEVVEMKESTKDTKLNDSLGECEEDMDETQLPLAEMNYSTEPVDAHVDKGADTDQVNRCIDVDCTKPNEGIGSSRCEDGDKQIVSPGKVSDDSKFDQTIRCNGTKHDEEDTTGSCDDKRTTVETPLTEKPRKKDTENKCSNTPTSSAKVKPSFGKKKTIIAPKTKPASSPASKVPKHAVDSKTNKDKPRKNSSSSAKNNETKSPSAATNDSKSPAIATTVDTKSTDIDHTTDCNVSNENTDTETSNKVQSDDENTDKSVKSKDSKLSKKKCEQSTAKKQAKEKAMLLKKQETERKRAEKDRLKQEKRLEQEQRKAEREQKRMEKELKKLERERIKAEKLATAKNKKSKSHPKPDKMTTDKQSSDVTSNEADVGSNKQCEQSEISLKDSGKTRDSTVTSSAACHSDEPECHNENTNCDTNIQQTSTNEYAKPLIHSSTQSSEDDNLKEDGKTASGPSLSETATPLTESTTAISTNDPSLNKDGKIEQPAAHEESDSTSTPLSKLGTTKPDQKKPKKATKKFSTPKQQQTEDKKSKKKVLDSTIPAKTSINKKQPLKQSSPTANKQKGKKRKATSTESDEPQLKRSKTSNYSGPVWVQCENIDCGKWRQLKDCQDPALVPDEWTCSMNSDENHNSCLAPEERWSDFGDSQEFIESPFVPGSIVWAKMDGYPWWPAMIEEDPDDEAYYKLDDYGDSLVPVEYHVVFFDRIVCRAWVSFHHVTSFTNQSSSTNPNEDVRVVKRLKIPLREATRQAKKALALDTKERLSQFGFIKRYHQNSRKRKSNPPQSTGSATTSRGRKSARLMTNVQHESLTATKHKVDDNTSSHDEEWNNKGVTVAKKIQSSSKIHQAEE